MDDIAKEVKRTYHIAFYDKAEDEWVTLSNSSYDDIEKCLANLGRTYVVVAHLTNPPIMRVIVMENFVKSGKQLDSIVVKNPTFAF